MPAIHLYSGNGVPRCAPSGIEDHPECIRQELGGVFHKDPQPLNLTVVEAKNSPIEETRSNYCPLRNMSGNVDNSNNSATNGIDKESEGSEIYSGLLAGSKVSISRLLPGTYH